MILFFRPFFIKSESTAVKKPGVGTIQDQLSEYLLKNSNTVDQVTGSAFSIGMPQTTPTVFYTPTMQPTPTIQITPTPVIQVQVVNQFVPIIEGQELIRFRYSYYYPPLGGVNCRDFVDGVCMSTMASGDPWQDWLRKAVACSSEIPLGSKIVVVAPEQVKGVYFCMDRGGGIEGTDLIDFLDDVQRLPWLEYVYAYVTK